MPSVSKSQQRLFQAAEHGATFPMAKKLRKSMTHSQLHDFAVGSESGKPQHVLKGDHPSIVHENAKTYRASGMNEHDAMAKAIKVSRHKNLGKHLYPRKDGKPHGTDK